MYKTDKFPVTISHHLGTGEQGRRRKDALLALADERGFMHNGKPSIGRMLVAMADKAGSKPEARPVSAEKLHIVAEMTPQELDDLDDAIHIARLRMMVRRLRAAGFAVTDGDGEGWGAWMQYVLVREPDGPTTVYADLGELRVLLDTVREMKDPAAAFERWLPKVKAMADE